MSKIKYLQILYGLRRKSSNLRIVCETQHVTTSSKILWIFVVKEFTIFNSVSSFTCSNCGMTKHES